jgi:hypothetical protein
VSRRWQARAALVGSIWALVFAVMAWLDMGPRPALLAGIAVALAAGLWLMVDISDRAAPATWAATYDTGGTRRGADSRLRVLHRQIQHAPTHDEGRVLHRLLVDLIDDRLLAEHGIDRVVEPARAAAELGADLASFVTLVPSARQLSDPSFLSSILTRIEAL